MRRLTRATGSGAASGEGRGGRRVAMVYAAFGILAGVFFINICDAVFSCGCVSLWRGAAHACNIHNAVAPHCPWCEHPVGGGAVAFFAMLGAPGVWILLATRLSLPARVLLAAATFPLVAAAVGIVQGLVWGYWS